MDFVGSHFVKVLATFKISRKAWQIVPTRGVSTSPHRCTPNKCYLALLSYVYKKFSEASSLIEMLALMPMHLVPYRGNAIHTPINVNKGSRTSSRGWSYWGEIDVWLTTLLPPLFLSISACYITHASGYYAHRMKAVCAHWRLADELHLVNFFPLFSSLLLEKASFMVWWIGSSWIS